MKNQLKVTVTPADTACCTLNLDKDEKNQRDVISHYCFIVYFQRTANDAENMKSSCSPLHGERQIFSFCWVTSNPSSGAAAPKLILEHLDVQHRAACSLTQHHLHLLCTLPALTAAFHPARLESALFAKLPVRYRSALQFCLTRSSSGSLITTDRFITVSITSLTRCQQQFPLINSSVYLNISTEPALPSTSAAVPDQDSSKQQKFQTTLILLFSNACTLDNFCPGLEQIWEKNCVLLLPQSLLSEPALEVHNYFWVRQTNGDMSIMKSPQDSLTCWNILTLS